jgi:DNA-binding NarL/FixJ family response regulator
MRQIRILMVDDHNLFREGLSRLLETGPAFVLLVSVNVAEAISALAEMTIDIVFLDFDLDEEQGYSLLAEIKKSELEIKVLMANLIQPSFGIPFR